MVMPAAMLVLMSALGAHPADGVVRSAYARCSARSRSACPDVEIRSAYAEMLRLGSSRT